MSQRSCWFDRREGIFRINESPNLRNDERAYAKRCIKRRNKKKMAKRQQKLQRA